MVLRFFSIVGKADVDPVVAVERGAHNGTERDPLVGGPEDDIEVDTSLAIDPVGERKTRWNTSGNKKDDEMKSKVAKLEGKKNNGMDACAAIVPAAVGGIVSEVN